MKHYLVVMTVFIGEYEKTARSLVAASDEDEGEKLGIEGEIHCSYDELVDDNGDYYDGEFGYRIYSVREVPEELLAGVQFAMSWS